MTKCAKETEAQVRDRWAGRPGNMGEQIPRIGSDPMTESITERAWPSFEEDPLSGLPNLLALICDMKGNAPIDHLAMAGFDLRRFRETNAQIGTDAADRILIETSGALAVATARLGIKGAKVYRVGGDEFCAVLPGASDCDRLLEILGRIGILDRLRHASVSCACQGGDLQAAFVKLWPLLVEALQVRPGPGFGQVEQMTQILVEKVRETAMLLRASRELAYTDDVSGLPNQRAARYYLSEYLSRDEDPRLGFLFIDGDNLRTYNDALGYEAGNDMIRRLGNAISSATVPGELVARWLSGDEFVAVLPGKSKEEAVLAADTIRQAVEEQSKVWPYPVTVSVGVAAYPEDSANIASLIAKSQGASLRAKRAGKNRVCEA